MDSEMNANSGSDDDPSLSTTGIQQGTDQPHTAATPSGPKRDKVDEWKDKAQELEAELCLLRPVVKENQRLRRCVGGVRVLGCALKETRKEVQELRKLASTSTNPSDKPCPVDTDGKAKVQNIDIPPNNEIASNHADKTSEACPGEPPGEQDGNQIPQKFKTMDNGQNMTHHARENYHDQTMEGEVDAGQLGQSKWSEVLDATEIIPSNRDQETEMSTKETEPMSGNQEDNLDMKHEASCESHSKGPMASDMVEGAVCMVNATADIAAVEALLKELSPGNASSPGNQTKLYVVTPSNVRSVATITEAEDSLIGLTLAKQEQSSLKLQVQELRRVNIGWESYCKKQKAEYIAQLEEKDATICRIQEQLDDTCAEATKRAEHYDQMLLTAKTRIDKAEENCKGLECELEQERLKSEKSEQLSRNLAKQNQNMSEEIARLKQALERTYQQKLHVTQSHSSPAAELVDNLPQHKSPNTIRMEYSSAKSSSKSGHTEPGHTKISPLVVQCAASAPMPLAAPADAQIKNGAKSPSGGKTRRQAAEDRPKTARCDDASATTQDSSAKDQQNKSVTDKNLDKHELKEQLELLRQQNQMFQSDFNKEHAEKEKALSKLQTFQRKLNKSKGRLHGYEPRPQLKEPTVKHEALAQSKVHGPKLDVYKPPRPVTSNKTHHQPQVKPTRKDIKDVTVVQCGKNTTCQLVNPNTVIIHTDPEGQRLNINSAGRMEVTSKQQGQMEPFQCPRCQKLFRGNDWESYEHHVTLCNI